MLSDFMVSLGKVVDAVVPSTPNSDLALTHGVVRVGALGLMDDEAFSSVNWLVRFTIVVVQLLYKRRMLVDVESSGLVDALLEVVELPVGLSGAPWSGPIRHCCYC